MEFEEFKALKIGDTVKISDLAGVFEKVNSISVPETQKDNLKRELNCETIYQVVDKCRPCFHVYIQVKTSRLRLNFKMLEVTEDLSFKDQLTEVLKAANIG